MPHDQQQQGGNMAMATGQTPPGKIDFNNQSLCLTVYVLSYNCDHAFKHPIIVFQERGKECIISNSMQRVLFLFFSFFVYFIISFFFYVLALYLWPWLSFSICA